MQTGQNVGGKKMAKIKNTKILPAMDISKKSIRNMMPLQNEMPPMVDIGEFTKHKVSEEFMKSCEIAGRLFKPKAIPS